MKTQQGFLLIEATIFMMVVAIVLAVLLPKAGDVIDAANETARVASVQGVQSAIYVYYINHGKYPTVAQLNNSLNPKGTVSNDGITNGDYKIYTFENTNCTDKTDNTTSDVVKCVK